MHHWRGKFKACSKVHNLENGTINTSPRPQCMEIWGRIKTLASCVLWMRRDQYYKVQDGRTGCNIIQTKACLHTLHSFFLLCSLITIRGLWIHHYWPSACLKTTEADRRRRSRVYIRHSGAQLGTSPQWMQMGAGLKPRAWAHGTLSDTM